MLMINCKRRHREMFLILYWLHVTRCQQKCEEKEKVPVYTLPAVPESCLRYASI